MRTAVVAAIIAVGLMITGCSTGGAGLDAQTSEGWQARVVAIAQAADAADRTAALAELDALEAEAVQARKDGQISAERAVIIQQSIGLVRADLEAASAVPEDDTAITETVAPTEQTTSNDDDEDDNGKKNDNANKDNSGNKGNKNNNGNKKDDD